ncbi:MAG: PIG-L family deacetylase [Chloroflexota bacterium]|nr:PIG-L family deacetylase [Chloroflexota bacterium]
MDVTEPSRLPPLDEDWERALCVVAHPDDMEYGASSAVARWSAQGKKVAYLMVTRGQAGIQGMAPEKTGELRTREEVASAQTVGVEDVRFLDLPDGTLEYGLSLRREIARAIRRHRPQVLVSLNWELTWGGRHLNQADHRVVGLAAIDAARDAGNRWIFTDLVEAGLEPWPGARMICFAGSPNPTHGVDVTGYLEQGIRSLQEQKVYIEGLGGEFDADSFLRGGAEAAGKLMGVDLAVLLEVYAL